MKLIRRLIDEISIIASRILFWRTDRDLARLHAQDSVNWIGKWLIYGARKRTEREYCAPNTFEERRNSILAKVYSGEGGLHWAKTYLAMPYDWSVVARDGRYAMLDAALTTCDDGTTALFSGCSSGREVAAYARRYPAHHFLGFDFNDSVVEFCRDMHEAPNLRFDVLDLTNPNDVSTLVCGDIMFVAGTFVYLTGPALRNLLDTLPSRIQMLVIGASVDMGYDYHAEHISRYKGLFSWSHPYPQLLRQSGYTYQYTEEAIIYPWAKNISILACRERLEFERILDAFFHVRRTQALRVAGGKEFQALF